MTNSFSSFEYEKVPDYAAQLDKRFAEENEAMKLVEAQIRDNNRMREKAAGQNAKTWQALADLAPKAAKAFSKYAQHQDKKYEAGLQVLLNESGTTYKDYKDYHAEDKENKEFDNLGLSLARKHEALAEEEGADYTHHITLANQFRSWSGRDIKRASQLIMWREANNIETSFNNVRDTLQLDDGTTWAGADPTQKRELWDQFLKDHGLERVLSFSNVLKKDAFWSKVNSTRDAILKAESRKYLQDGKAARKANGIERITEAGNYSAQALFDTFHDVVDQTWTDYNKQDKQFAYEALWGQVLDGVGSGDISGEVAHGFLNLLVEHKGMVSADGTKRKVPAKTFFKFDAEERLREVTNKVAEARETEKNNLRTQYGQNFDKEVIDKGGVIYEAEIEEAIKQWKANPETKHMPLPDELTKWTTRTVEDENDDDVIEFLEKQLDDPLTPVDINRAYLIYDETKREAIIKRIEGVEGTGITSTKKTSIEKSLAKVVKAKLGLDFGEAGNTPEVEDMTNSALSNYLKYYREGRGQYESDAANHKQAMDAVRAEINDGIHYEDQRGIDTTKGYAKKMERIRSHIAKNPDNFLAKRLPGMKADYAQLEAWAANPDRTSFPAIWQTMADRYPVYEVVNGVRRKVGGYEWAQENYRNIYGKELPPVTGPSAEIDAEIKGKPNYWKLTTSMNKRPTLRGIQAEESGTINAAENLTVGVG